MRERYSRKFQTQFSRQKRKTQKKVSLSLSLSLCLFKYRTTSFLVLLLISLSLVLFSLCYNTLSNHQQVSNLCFLCVYLNCCPYSHGLRFVRWESALCFGLHSRCLSRVSPWICSFSSFWCLLFLLSWNCDVVALFGCWETVGGKKTEAEKLLKLDLWVFLCLGVGKVGVFYLTYSNAATLKWKRVWLWYSVLFLSVFAFFGLLFFLGN